MDCNTAILLVSNPLTNVAKVEVSNIITCMYVLLFYVFEQHSFRTSMSASAICDLFKISVRFTMDHEKMKKL